MDYREKSEAHNGLLPCPFCGEKKHLYLCYPSLGHGDPYAIDCLGCGYDFEPRAGRDVKAAWNRRASSDSHKALVEALTKDVERLVRIREKLLSWDDMSGTQRADFANWVWHAENETRDALRLAGEDQS